MKYWKEGILMTMMTSGEYNGSSEGHSTKPVPKLFWRVDYALASVHSFPRGVLWRQPWWYSAMRYVALTLQWVHELYSQTTYKAMIYFLSTATAKLFVQLLVPRLPPLQIYTNTWRYFLNIPSLCVPRHCNFHLKTNLFQQSSMNYSAHNMLHFILTFCTQV